MRPEQLSLCINLPLSTDGSMFHMIIFFPEVKETLKYRMKIMSDTLATYFRWAVAKYLLGMHRPLEDLVVVGYLPNYINYRLSIEETKASIHTSWWN